MKISRVWAMPNRWTFCILPVMELLNRYCANGIGWVDPFSGENSPAEKTNDINPERPARYHMDALDFLKKQPTNSADGVLLDPPYSFTQAKECYDAYGADLFIGHDYKPTKMDYWASCKREIARIIKTGGIVISFGWNSNGVGRNRGFEMLEILLIPHGGGRTIQSLRSKENLCTSWSIRND